VIALFKNDFSLFFGKGGSQVGSLSTHTNNVRQEMSATCVFSGDAVVDEGDSW
jgi:hypothetical protein